MSSRALREGYQEGREQSSIEGGIPGGRQTVGFKGRGIRREPSSRALREEYWEGGKHWSCFPSCIIGQSLLPNLPHAASSYC
jgi:hypothetical protein